MTTLSLLIPTAGRETLRRCLESIQYQVRDGDEVMVIGDVADGPLPTTEAIVASFGSLVTYVEHDAGHHCFGHCPLSYGLTIARGDYVHGNDDDDIWADDALDRIRARIDELEKPAPLLFRFVSWFGPVFWDEPGVARENHIGGHCAVFPNDERLGRFTCRYQGDYDYIRSTLDNWGGDDKAVWVDDVIAIARPAVVRRDEVLA